MRTFIIAGQLINCTGAQPKKNQVVVVEDGKILDILEKNQIDIRSKDNGDVIDCGNDTLMAGLIDSHLHIGEDAIRDETVLQQHLQPDALRAIRGAMTMQADLLRGVTSARSLGDGTGYIDVVIRDAINRGEIKGPKLQVAGHAIRPTHGTMPGVAMIADGVEEVRKSVRQAVFNGADVIKMAISNISTGNSYLDYLKGDLTQVSAYSKPELEVAVEEASRCGLKVSGHCIGGDVVKWALEAGFASLEHANLIKEDDIPYFIKYGGYISDPNLILFFDPTYGFESPTIKTHKWNDLPDWWHEKVRRTREQTKRVMGLALKEGVKFALGTDLNHGNLWLECKYFIQEIGATPMQAIMAVTSSTAELMGVSGETGSIQIGKCADIIVLDGDPLEDISSLSRINLVMQDGNVIKKV
ncbi:MAG: amidohydrolase family protein [Flexilinea sp.]